MFAIVCNILLKKFGNVTNVWLFVQEDWLDVTREATACVSCNTIPTPLSQLTRIRKSSFVAGNKNSEKISFQMKRKPCRLSPFYDECTDGGEYICFLSQYPITS